MAGSKTATVEPEIEETKPVERTERSPKRGLEQQTKDKPKTQPPYAVILHNDNLNGMDFVIGVLRKVFHYGRLKSLQLMLAAHFTGRAIVWSGSLEVAELKAEQIKSCGPDPAMKSRGALALRVTVEPLPK